MTLCDVPLTVRRWASKHSKMLLNFWKMHFRRLGDGVWVGNHHKSNWLCDQTISIEWRITPSKNENSLVISKDKEVSENLINMGFIYNRYLKSRVCKTIKREGEAYKIFTSYSPSNLKQLSLESPPLTNSKFNTRAHRILIKSGTSSHRFWPTPPQI